MLWGLFAHVVRNPPIASMPFRKRSMEDFTLHEGKKYPKLNRNRCVYTYIYTKFEVEEALSL